MSANDPVVLGTLAMFFWLLAAAAVNRFYRPAQTGRKVAYLTLVSFVFLAVALGLALGLGTSHGGWNQWRQRPPAMEGERR